jgi:hypothetical protein
LSRRIIDQLDTVACVAVRWLEVVLWRPDEVSSVWVILDDGVLWDGVLGWTLEEDESDGAGGGRVPADGVSLASWHDIMQTGCVDRVALGLSADLRAYLSVTFSEGLVLRRPTGWV